MDGFTVYAAELPPEDRWQLDMFDDADDPVEWIDPDDPSAAKWQSQGEWHAAMCERKQAKLDAIARANAALAPGDAGE